MFLDRFLSVDDILTGMKFIGARGVKHITTFTNLVIGHYSSTLDHLVELKHRRKLLYANEHFQISCCQVQKEDRLCESIIIQQCILSMIVADDIKNQA